MEVAYTPNFLRMVKALPLPLQEEAFEKIKLFRDTANHNQLKVHKLYGRLAGRYSFSVNYAVRIVFRYSSTHRKEALLLAIGDHDVYR
jgi:plasmid maintenance system killer protein